MGSRCRRARTSGVYRSNSRPAFPTTLFGSRHANLVALGAVFAAAFVPVLQVGDAVPATPLVDQRGKPFDFDRLRGQTVVVAFIYTRCRDANECPLVSAKLVRVQNGLGLSPIHIVSITVDPTHDNPAALAAYGRIFAANPARWTFVTGKPPAVTLLERRLGVDVTHVSSGDLAHTEEILILGPDGRIADRIGGSAWTSDEISARALSVARMPSDRLANLRLSLTRGIEAMCGGGVSGISLAVALAIFLAAVATFGIVASRALLSTLR